MCLQLQARKDRAGVIQVGSHPRLLKVISRCFFASVSARIFVQCKVLMSGSRASVAMRASLALQGVLVFMFLYLSHVPHSQQCIVQPPSHLHSLHHRSTSAVPSPSLLLLMPFSSSASASPPSPPPPSIGPGLGLPPKLGNLLCVPSGRSDRLGARGLCLPRALPPITGIS